MTGISFRSLRGAHLKVMINFHPWDWDCEFRFTWHSQLIVHLERKICPINWTKFGYKLNCNLKLQLPLKKLTMLHILKIIVGLIFFFYILNTHVKFCTNNVIYFWSIILFFMHNFIPQKFRNVYIWWVIARTKFITKLSHNIF